MSSASEPTTVAGQVTVRYWASARAAAGTDQELVAVSEPTTLADLLAALRERHRTDAPRLSGVLDACSVLVGDRPVGGHDPAQVRLAAGDSVEFLPPFAGG